MDQFIKTGYEDGAIIVDSGDDNSFCYDMDIDGFDKDRRNNLLLGIAGIIIEPQKKLLYIFAVYRDGYPQAAMNLKHGHVYRELRSLVYEPKKITFIDYNREPSAVVTGFPEKVETKSCNRTQNSFVIGTEKVTVTLAAFELTRVPDILLPEKNKKFLDWRPQKT